ncbi:hypothetical protein F5882DRAFT_465146 [Hyaloscypha sp. PMI_1271]|nr:hypothetical protein F5882DRAFT_465146 [Hyaloscypha sp. PMI_1271]
MHFIKVLEALAILSTSAIVSASRHNGLVCCVLSSGKWQYVATLTKAVCQYNYPADGEFRNNACYGVHTELDGKDFWNNCKDTGLAGWTDSDGGFHKLYNKDNIGSGTNTGC